VTKLSRYKNLTTAALISLLLMAVMPVTAQYAVRYTLEDKPGGFVLSPLALTTSFSNRIACVTYLTRLPALLKSRGFITASIDTVRYDSANADVHLFIGEVYQWLSIRTHENDKMLLKDLGWNEKLFNNRSLDFNELGKWQQRILNYHENNGYPFAKVGIDSVQIDKDKVMAVLNIEKGPQYKIDSIRVYGEVKIANSFLRRYLAIDNGSLYRKDRLQQVSRKILELPYMQESQPSSLTMLGTGSILNLYLKPRRSSQVNLLIGFLPNNQSIPGLTSKLLVTGEATVNLKNALGLAETIFLNWQRLQPESQRLNIAYQQPYLLNTPLGVDFSFELYKRDSAFVNLNIQAGAQYFITGNHTFKLYLLSQRTNLGTFDTNFVKINKRLPENIDLSLNNIGIDYELYATNYRFNPRRGNELIINFAAGSKKIRRNNDVLQLKDPANPSFNFGTLYDTLSANSYQLRWRMTAAHYIPAGKQAVIKTAINGGLLLSPNIFRSELFQIGGYRLLRGFDEESILASQYFTATAEYRYLTGINSYLFAFGDYGWAANKSRNSLNKNGNSYIGAGLGLALEIKSALLNMSFALGKRPVDNSFNFRQAKIHIGYINYF
jgi:outer membrane protein assembly factor BamA